MKKKNKPDIIIPTNILQKPIAVVEIKRMGKWWKMFDVFQKNNLGQEIVFSPKLGEITGLRIKYLKKG